MSSPQPLRLTLRPLRRPLSNVWMPQVHTHTFSPLPRTSARETNSLTHNIVHFAEDQTDTGAAAGSTPDQQENGTQTTPTDQQEATTTPGQEGAEPGKEGAGPGKEGEGGKEKGKQPEAKKPKKPAVKYTDLPIGEKTVSLGKKQLDDMREKEVNMNYQDQLEKQKIDAKNAVEEYVYSMRDKVRPLHHHLCTLSMGDLLHYIIS